MSEKITVRVEVVDVFGRTSTSEHTELGVCEMATAARLIGLSLRAVDSFLKCKDESEVIKEFAEATFSRDATEIK